MITIRPISDLRNKFTDIENVVNGGETVFLARDNGVVTDEDLEKAYKLGMSI